MEKARVFNIERASSEDGPGIRTVVFLKGCALRCKWCANPESQSPAPEILHIANACVNCGTCMHVCPNHAIVYREGFGYITDQSACTLCRRCVDECLADARKFQGEEYTAEQLVREVRRDEQYFKKSGGGITFSGGEPLLEAKFICQAADMLREYGIPSLVETCGHVPEENLRLAAGCVDAFYYDFKHIDPEEHRKLTGQSNELIKRNLEWLEQNYGGFLAVRYPYIPGCNDSEAAIRGFLEYVKDFRSIDEIYFLPYHRLGLPKYTGLGRVYPMGDMMSLKPSKLAHLVDWAAEYGLSVKIQ